LRQYIKSPEERSTIGDEGTMWPQVRSTNVQSGLALGTRYEVDHSYYQRYWLRIDRFNRLLESIKGLTPWVLSIRLKELEKEGHIECLEKKKSPIYQNNLGSCWLSRYRIFLLKD
jgi:hypothetical protein